MEIIGTNFSITLGSWRVRLGFAIEDMDDVEPPQVTKPLAYAGLKNEKPSSFNVKR
jgi:hypothetical protein